MNPVLLRNVIFPLYHRLTGSGVMDRLRELKHNQWLSQDELLTLQKKKLCRLLCHAYENVPFYQERLKASGLSRADLDDPTVVSSLPLLTKKEINEHRQAMLSQNKAGGRLLANSTSGSTGEALRFFTDMHSTAHRRAVVLRNQEWLKVKLGEPRASLWGATMDIKRLANIRGRVHRWLNNYIILSSYNLASNTLREYISELNRFSPVLLTSYPGPVTELAKFMLSHGLNVPSVKAIISSAETLHSWQKEIVEQAFSCPVYNRYGSREFGDMAHECECREGMHIHVDRCLIEILDDMGKPCSPGVSGEIVVTDLDNYGMPLIRYRIGDRGKLSVGTCSCGRGLPLFAEIEGRTLDVIRASNGNVLGGTFWTLLFRSRRGILSFQVIQEEISGIIVKYVPDESGDNGSLEYFSDKIKEKCGDDFRVDFQRVERIEQTVSGKTRFVISRLNHLPEKRGEIL